MTSVDLPEPDTPVTQVRRPERDRDVDPLQVVLAGAADDELAASACRRSSGTGIATLRRQVLAGQRRRVADRPAAGVPCGDDPAAVLAGAGAEVDDVVGGADRVLVVLDDDHGVAEVAEALQRRDQLRVVALVQPDRRLVEDVEHADQAGADLGREPDPLRLAAGQRRRRPLQRQVADPDRVEEAQPLLDLADDQPAIARSVSVSSSALDPLERRRAESCVYSAIVEPADRHREALRPQPGAAAGRAGLQGHQALDPLAGLLGVGVLVAALEARSRCPRSGRV